MILITPVFSAAIFVLMTRGHISLLNHNSQIQLSAVHFHSPRYYISTLGSKQHPRLKPSLSPAEIASWWDDRHYDPCFLVFMSCCIPSTLDRADLCNQEKIVEMMKCGFQGLVIKLWLLYCSLLDYRLKGKPAAMSWRNWTTLWRGPCGMEDASYQQPALTC